jgi:hypothetical protein
MDLSCGRGKGWILLFGGEFQSFAAASGGRERASLTRAARGAMLVNRLEATPLVANPGVIAIPRARPHVGGDDLCH